MLSWIYNLGCTKCIDHLGLKNSWEMFRSKFPEAPVINPCPRTTIYSYCAKINVLGDILYAGGNVEEQEDFGFSGSFFKKIYYRRQYQK